MLVRFCAVLAASGILSVSAVEDRGGVEQARQTLAKWVETRQLTAKLRSDWESDREVLSQTIKLFEKELATIEEQFAKTGGGSEQIDQERADLRKEKESLQEGAARVKELLGSLEGSIRELAKALPTPLLAKIEALLKRMPSDPGETKMTAMERMQMVVGILSEVDKFNGAISVNTEIQKNAQGEEVQVKTLYLGLGQAYWVDKSGRAGTGVPDSSGWTWKEESALAPRIAQAIAIYESSQPAAFVSLPVTLK